MTFLRSPLFRLSAVALAFAGLLIASPVQAKDKKDKKDKHSDHDDRDHGRDGNWFRGDWHRDDRDRNSNHDHHHNHYLEVRSCYSHDHHHSHVWHSRRSHQDYRCPGHR